MKFIKALTLIFSFTLALTLAGCGKDNGGGENPASLSGTWRLSKITVNVDGNLLTQVSPLISQGTFSDGTYTYSDNGSKSGTWSLSDDESELTVSYGTTAATYAVSSKSATDLTFLVKEIDLSIDLSSEDIPIALLANQELLKASRDWDTATTGATTATILFTLTKS